MQVSFIQHFMGCQTCSAWNRNGDLATCRSAMFHSFRYAAEKQRGMIADAPPRSEAELAQLRRLPFCSFNTSADGCAGAVPRSRPPPAVEQERNVDWKSVDSAVVASVRVHVRPQGRGSAREALGKAHLRSAANDIGRMPKRSKLRTRARADQA